MAVAKNIRAIDTYVDAAKPNTSFSSAPRLRLGHWSSAAPAYAYVTFWQPFPIGAKITRATLTLETYAMPEAGSHSIYVVPVTSPTGGFSRLTYADRPSDDTSREVRVTKTGPLPGATQWSFDVTEFVQDVSDGQPWYGWRIATGDTDAWRWIYSREEASAGGDGPMLTVEYADEPSAPTTLSPNEGVVGSAKPQVSFEYVDFGGNTKLSRVRVQTSSSPSFSSGVWDSGEINTLTPVIDLSKTSFPGATAGARVYYRIKARDGDNLWSDWSPAAWFIYQPTEALTITSPVPANPLFTDSSPDISWQVTGTQTAYQVTIARKSKPERYIYNSGKVGSVGTRSLNIPTGKLRWDDETYVLVVRTWDDKDRVRAPGALPYNRVELDVLLDEDLSSTPVSWVKAEQVGNRPVISVTWARAASADHYEIARQREDGKKIIIGRISHAEAIRQDGTYRYLDYTAPGKTSLRYIVRPITNGKRSAGVPSAYRSFDIEGIWLVDADGNELMIAGSDQGDWSLPENETAHHVIGARAPVVIRELHRGYEGSINGLLVDEDRYQRDLSAQDKYELFLRFKRGLREPRLIAADQNIPVRLANMNAYPTPDWDLRYECSFNFWQYDEVWWEDLP